MRRLAPQRKIQIAQESAQAPCCRVDQPDFPMGLVRSDAVFTRWSRPGPRPSGDVQLPHPNEVTWAKFFVSPSKGSFMHGFGASNEAFTATAAKRDPLPTARSRVRWVEGRPPNTTLSICPHTGARLIAPVVLGRRSRLRRNRAEVS